MERTAIDKIPQPEWKQPGHNPFMEVLAATLNPSRHQTPFQRFQSKFRQLEKIAAAGDLSGWQRSQRELQECAEEARIDLKTDLEAKVRLKQLEMTLLLKAGNRALQEAKHWEKKALEAQGENCPDLSRDHFLRSQKMESLAKNLHQQLLAGFRT